MSPRHVRWAFLPYQTIYLDINWCLEPFFETKRDNVKTISFWPLSTNNAHRPNIGLFVNPILGLLTISISAGVLVACATIRPSHRYYRPLGETITLLFYKYAFLLRYSLKIPPRNKFCRNILLNSNSLGNRLPNTTVIKRYNVIVWVLARRTHLIHGIITRAHFIDFKRRLYNHIYTFFKIKKMASPPELHIFTFYDPISDNNNRLKYVTAKLTTHTRYSTD